MGKVIGLLSWFDESPTRLAATVASFARVCEHVVALDGRYALYPDDRVRSGVAEYEAITDAAHAAGIGLTIQSATEPWMDEMAKRTALFRLGSAIATRWEDWFLILDADEVLAETPSKGWLEAQLEHAREEGCDVATATLWEKADPAETPEREVMSNRFPIEHNYATPQCRFWRALEDLRVVGYHYNYLGTAEDGSTRELWGSDAHVRERAGWSDTLRHHVTIENRNRMRPKVRDATRQRYYDRRTQTNAERLAPLTELEEAHHGAHV